MRLINATTLRLTESFGDNIPSYAILSHTWGNEEVSFQDMQQPDVHVQNKAGLSKILKCCEQAKKDGIEGVWVDTCCIDKTSSAELSEAINSMFKWYQEAEVCYAFLEDVHAVDFVVSRDKFKQARWFTRGWCLQELLAPPKIEFYSSDWTEFGTKWSLRTQIAEITGIPNEVLLNKSPLKGYSVAQKMSWASKRRTTRMEDEAYCLLGIFGISMPLLYGEGWRAFHRLQEEIMKQTEDYSIFLWTEGRLALRTNFGVLAPSPSSFCEGSLKNFGKTYLYRDINSVFLSRGLARKILPQSSVSGNPSQMTPRGLYINTFARKYGKKTQLWTGCIHGEVYLCIEIHIIRDDGFSQYGRTGMPNFKWFVEAREAQHFELSEFYLNTDENYGLRRAASTHFTGLPIPIQPGFQQKVVLSSRCTESITYIDAFPPMIANEIFSCTEDQQVISLKGEKGSYTVQDTTFSLRFKVFHAITKSLIDHFIVSFGVQGQSSWCTVVEILASGLSSLEDAGTRCFKLGKLREWMCDRSIERLPSGRVIHVATKFTSSKDGIRGKAEPVCYTLHITLLEGKSKPNA